MRSRVGVGGGWGLGTGLAALLAVVGAGCQEDAIVAAAPDIRVSAGRLDFGLVQTGTAAWKPVSVENLGRVRLDLDRVAIEDDPAAPGGGSAFVLMQAAPTEVVSEATLEVVFAPTALGDYQARLTIESDDPDPGDRLKVVTLAGRGATALVRLVPECASPCSEFAATLAPPAIDFGSRLPLRRGASGVVVEPAWPTVTLINDGELPLRLSGAALKGDPGFGTIESLNAQGLVVEPGGSHILHVTFDPQQASSAPLAASLVLTTDDPAVPTASVSLTGQLLPNQPPQACASIVEVRQPDGSTSYPRDEAGAFAFGGFVSVQPGDQTLVHLSAFSDHFQPGLHPFEASQGDESLCTTDLEDGREALAYQWSVIERPSGSANEVIDATSPEPLFRPDAIGHFVIRLTVTDPWGALATADVAFDALPVRDLAAQLSWAYQPGVDLDVHLVKPGPCGDKADCTFDRRGDIDGYLAARTSGFFDWGLPGVAWDDPRLDMDDQGDKSLLEIVSLNYPQLDPACRHARCTYDVYVHFFKDWRAASYSAPACPGRPCQGGTACGCPEIGAGRDSVCVSGRCVTPVRPAVKLFLQPTPTKPGAALEVPAKGEDFSLPGPCVLWHVARVQWPSLDELYKDPQAAPVVEEVGTPGQRELSFWGSLAPQSLSCAPNTPPGTPPLDVTFLPGTVPSYP
ncbi:MAG: choice-of-anchor D domain-containing protein [Myxococcales bacterium]